MHGVAERVNIAGGKCHDAGIAIAFSDEARQKSIHRPRQVFRTGGAEFARGHENHIGKIGQLGQARPAQADRKPMFRYRRIPDFCAEPYRKIAPRLQFFFGCPPFRLRVERAALNSAPSFRRRQGSADRHPSALLQQRQRRRGAKEFLPVQRQSLFACSTQFESSDGINHLIIFIEALAKTHAFQAPLRSKAQFPSELNRHFIGIQEIPIPA